MARVVDLPRAAEPIRRIVGKLENCGCGLNALSAAIDGLEAQLESVLRRTGSGDDSELKPAEVSPHSPLALLAEGLGDRIAAITLRIQGITERLEC